MTLKLMGGKTVKVPMAVAGGPAAAGSANPANAATADTDAITSLRGEIIDPSRSVAPSLRPV
jgi:hypothetical protein